MKTSELIELNKQIKTTQILEACLRLLKLGIVLSESNSKEVLGFVVELTNSLNSFYAEKATICPDKELKQSCLILIEKFDEIVFKNYKYLVKQNIEKIK